MATVKKPAAPATGRAPKSKATPKAKPKPRVTAEQAQRARDKKANAVLESMITGLSCYQACKKIGLPHTTFLTWVANDKQLADKYARAREDLIEFIAAQTLEIADAQVGLNDNGSTDHGAVQKQRLQVDTRKWLLSKLAPRKYGDRMMLTGDQDNPVQVQTTLDVKKLSTETLAEILKAQDEHKKS